MAGCGCVLCRLCCGLGCARAPYAAQRSDSSSVFHLITVECVCVLGGGCTSTFMNFTLVCAGWLYTDWVSGWRSGRWLPLEVAHTTTLGRQPFTFTSHHRNYQTYTRAHTSSPPPPTHTRTQNTCSHFKLCPSPMNYRKAKFN